MTHSGATSASWQTAVSGLGRDSMKEERTLGFPAVEGRATGARREFSPAASNAALPGEPAMLYLGIDLHRKQMTISLRNDDGDVTLRRQVSTRWPKLAEFCQSVRTEALMAFPRDRGRPERGV